MTDARTPSNGRSPLRWIVGILILVSVAIVARRMTAPPEFESAVAESRDIVESLAVVGRVRAPSRAALGASISGTVTTVLVEEGDRVDAGVLLVRLEDREASAAVRQAAATLADATARADQAVDDAEREAVLADRDLQRMRAVLEIGGVARQSLEQAEQRAGDARSRLEAARAAAPGGDNEPASIAAARAALESARARMALTRITAPAAGVVLTRSVEPGDAVSPGRGLLEVGFDGPSELIVFPGEENLSRLRPGAPARASADAFPEEHFAATVSLIAPTVDASQGTVAVRLTIVDPPAYLLPDMTVSVNIETGRKAAALVLPEDAVQGLGGGQTWIGLVAEGRLARRDVETGLRADGYVEIVSGLERGTEVLRSVDAEQLGEKVRVVRGEG